MAVVTNTTVENARATKTKNGWKVVRQSIFTIDNPTGKNWYDKVAEAVSGLGLEINVSTYGLPDCFLIQIDVLAVTPKAVKLQTTYSQPTAGSYQFQTDTIEFSAVASQESTNKDKYGDEITVKYTYPAGYKRSPHDTALTAAQDQETGKEVPIFVPDKVITYYKKKTTSPQSDMERYQNKTNTSTFYGYDAGMVLCTEISGRSPDGGQTWECVYRFRIRDVGWNPTVVFLRDDGKPPPETDEDSEKIVELYNSENFNNLI